MNPTNWLQRNFANRVPVMLPHVVRLSHRMARTLLRFREGLLKSTIGQLVVDSSTKFHGGFNEVYSTDWSQLRESRQLCKQTETADQENLLLESIAEMQAEVSAAIKNASAPRSGEISSLPKL